MRSSKTRSRKASPKDVRDELGATRKGRPIAASIAKRVIAEATRPEMQMLRRHDLLRAEPAVWEAMLQAIRMWLTFRW